MRLDAELVRIKTGQILDIHTEKEFAHEQIKKNDDDGVGNRVAHVEKIIHLKASHIGKSVQDNDGIIAPRQCTQAQAADNTGAQHDQRGEFFKRLVLTLRKDFI